MSSERSRVGRQTQLPLTKAVHISFRGLRNRFWRSIITMGGIILGITFLISIFVTDLVVKGLLEGGAVEIQYVLEAREVGSRAKQIWLISLSLLVCVVGITNAMLMSVTERFREIGTMKCLGALDSLIRQLFFLEAIFQGFLGSVGGILIGTVFVFLTSLVKYGGQVITTFPYDVFLVRAAIALSVGVVMAVVGAVFPASQAAKMAPAEAMATEM